MNSRILPLLLISALLGACAGKPTASVPPRPATPLSATPPPVALDEALPADQREIVGSLQNVAAGGEVELALLAVDPHDVPRRLLGSLRLRGSGAALPFRLRFNPDSFPVGGRVELRGRVSQSGMLVQRLAPRPILQPQNQNIGALQMVPVP